MYPVSIGWLLTKAMGRAANCSYLLVGGVSVPLRRSDSVALLIDAENERVAQMVLGLAAMARCRFWIRLFPCFCLRQPSIRL